MARDPVFRSAVRLRSLALDLTLYLALASALSWLIVKNFDPAFAELAAQPESGNSRLIGLNAAPAVILALLLLALTRRGVLSLGVSMGLLHALYFANAIKLELLDTPILPGDFSLLAHLGGGGELLAHYLSPDQMLWTGAVVLALIGLYVFERTWQGLRGLPRVGVLVLALGIGSSLALNLRPISSIYDDHPGRFLAWSPATSVRESGLPVTLLNYLWRMSLSSLPIDRAAASRLIDKYPLPAALPLPPELPDIIVLQSESLFDPARLKEIAPEESLPTLRELEAGHRHGDLRVPTYGGGTIRTEFEVLTGLAMQEFPTIQYPYFWLANKEKVPSLARTLAEKGYRTLAIHPNTRDFWNRAATFEHMGFDDFDAAEQFVDSERVGYYCSDDALVDRMIERLDQATQPLFMYAISIENHGPYDDYPNVDPLRISEQRVPDRLAPKARARLQGYLNHLANADRTLGRLVDFLHKRKRRNLLLFFGDHLPGLPQVYAQLEFDDGQPATSQPVPWLLVDSAKSPAASSAESTTSFYLPALLLDAAGIDDRGYFRLLDQLRRDDSAFDQSSVPDHGLGAIMRLQQRGELKINP